MASLRAMRFAGRAAWPAWAASATTAAAAVARHGAYGCMPGGACGAASGLVRQAWPGIASIAASARAMHQTRAVPSVPTGASHLAPCRAAWASAPRGPRAWPRPCPPWPSRRQAHAAATPGLSAASVPAESQTPSASSVKLPSSSLSPPRSAALPSSLAASSTSSSWWSSWTVSQRWWYASTAAAAATLLATRAHASWTDEDEDALPEPLPIAPPVRQRRGLFAWVLRWINRIYNVIRLSWRFLVLLALFLPVILTFPVWYVSILSTLKKRAQRDYEQNMLKERAEFESLSADALETMIREHVDPLVPSLWWIHYLTWSLERGGPTFVKLAQWASSRRDLFPKFVCDTLARLQSQVTPTPFWRIRRAFEREYGVPIETLFEMFNETPIGVGAIAQVYRARLRPSEALGIPEPTECAVKILHPGVATQIRDDITVIGFLARIIDRIPQAKWLSLPDEVEVFGSMMMDQCDLRTEGRNLIRFSEHFRDSPSISFPRPCVRLLRKRVLVETYLDALPLSLFLDEHHTAADRTLAEIGTNCFLHMLVFDNFVHADMHPGNIYVTFCEPHPGNAYVRRARDIASRHRPMPAHPDDPPPTPFIGSEKVAQLRAMPAHERVAEINRMIKQGYRPHMMLIDTGLVCELSPRNLTNFLDLFMAVAKFNGRRVAQLMVERSRTPWTAHDVPGFEDAMDEFLRSVRLQTLTLGQLQVGTILSKVFAMVQRHRIKLEGDFVNIGIAIALVEGIGPNLDPDLDLLQRALPILQEASTRGHAGIREMPNSIVWQLRALSLVKPFLHFSSLFVNLNEQYESVMIFFPE